MPRFCVVAVKRFIATWHWQKSFKKALSQVGLPETVVQFIETTDREAVGHLITLVDDVDVIVPRGVKA